MIKIEDDTGNLIRVTVTDKLGADDFQKLGAVADALIQKHGTVRLLLDGTHFQGWENLEAAEAHFGFVKNHHHNVERLAVIAGAEWQHWMAAMAGFFLHPVIKVFDKGELEAAQNWLSAA